jgi:hypothetical protein
VLCWATPSMPPRGRRGPRRAAYISDDEVVEARRDQRMYPWAQGRGRPPGAVRGRLRKRRRGARGEVDGRWDGRSGGSPVGWGVAPLVRGSAAQRASSGDGEAGNRKRPSPSQITRIAGAMYGNAAICVICLTKSTRQKKVGGANICGQPRGHTMVARYMRGKERKKKVGKRPSKISALLIFLQTSPPPGRA